MEEIYNKIIYIRNIFKDKLDNSDKIILKDLDLTKKKLDYILFDINKDTSKKKINKFFLDNINKFDFSDVSFDGCDLRFVNFEGSSGVKINPQTVYQKRFVYTNFCDVEFVSSFDGVDIYHVNFTGSKGALINPQTIKNKNLSFSKFQDVEFIGPFDDTIIIGSDFTGAHNVKINPQTVYGCDFYSVCDTVKVKKIKK